MKIFLILTLDNLKNSLRTRKAIIFLALYLLVFGLITYAFFNVQQTIDEQISAQNISGLQKSFITGFAQTIIKNNIGNESIVDFLFTIPPLNVVLFFVSLIGTPLLIFILNYDKVSQEIYDGTIRYLLFRVSRFQLFLAKFFSGIIECSAITLIALFLAVLWGSIRFGSVHFGQSIMYGLRYWLIAQFFLAVFVAFSLMTSAIFKKPFTSLIVAFASYIALAVLPFFVPYISPYDSKYFDGLFLGNTPGLILALLIYMVFTTLFLTLGYQIFKRIDL